MDRGLEAFSKFDEFESKVEDQEIQAEAMMKLSGQDAELDDLKDTTDVEIELAKLKKERLDKKKGNN